MTQPLCSECSLSGDRISGRGSDNPKVIFVGEAPGAEEEKQGIPFVGKAGQVLTSILNYLKVDEDDYYITNVCLCRPPENRTPTKDEIECCKGRLLGEIEARNPEVVVAMGKTPAQALFRDGSLKNIRGKLVESPYGFNGIITYHPAATLYAKGDTLFPYIMGDVEKALSIAKGITLYTEEQLDTEVVIVQSNEEMARLINHLHEMPSGTEIAFDWETTGLNPEYSTGFCLGLSWREGTAVSIPLEFVRRRAPDLRRALTKHQLVGFNAISFDVQWNRLYNLPDTVVFDPMLWHYLLDERPQQRSLENLTSFLLGAPCYESEMMARYKATKKTMIKEIPAEVVYEYCGKDVDWTLRLSNYFKKTVEQNPDLYRLYNNLLVPAAYAFIDIEKNGVWVNWETLEQVGTEMTDSIVGYLSRLCDITGKEDFNPNSHPQVQTFLWDELGLEQPKSYKRKDRSADGDTLLWLADRYPDEEFPVVLKEYRELFKLYSSYIKNLPDYIDPDNRVRCSYHFDRTETGRLSTTNPALHTIPRDGRIRNIFAAPPGCTLIQADYEQIEVRMAAHVAQDKKLTEMLSSGIDFHSYMAAHSANIDIAEVTEDHRQAAKALSFGLLYLMSDKGLIQKTGLDRDDAIDFIKSYKELMPEVQRWIEDIKALIRTEQVIVSPFGRRRRFPLLTKDNLDGLYREGVNFPIQSGASDITLSSLIRLHDFFKMYYPEVKIVIMVHDSIIVECPIPIAEDVAGIMKDAMEDVSLDTDVPFPVEIKISERWSK